MAARLRRVRATVRVRRKPVDPGYLQVVARTVPSGPASGFCAMVAVREAVYGTAWLAQRRGRNPKKYVGAVNPERNRPESPSPGDSDGRGPGKTRGHGGPEDNDDLPIDVHVDAVPGGVRDDRHVLSADQLDAWGKIAPDTDQERWKYFDRYPDEKAIAEWLANRGVVVRSVDEMKRRRPPDAVTTGSRSTPVEFKTLHPADSTNFNYLTCINNIAGVAGKCRRGVIDARDTDGDVESAMAAVRSGAGKYGANLDELVVIIRAHGVDQAVGWRRE